MPCYKRDPKRDHNFDNHPNQGSRPVPSHPPCPAALEAAPPVPRPHPGPEKKDCIIRGFTGLYKV